MTFPVVPVVLGAAAIGGIAWWLGGFSKGAVLTATALGTKDGCARGAADVKAGKTPTQASADVNSDKAITDAAVKSGDFAAYAKAYQDAHADCYTKNAVPGPTTTTDSDVKPVVPGPPVTPKKPPATTAEWYLDRVASQNDWFTWSRKGAQEGYNEYMTDYEYRDFGTKTAKSAARSCGYAQGWNTAKVTKKSFGSLGYPPKTIPLNVENSIFASCSTKFDAWYNAHKHDQYAGKGAMVSVSGVLVGWLEKAGQTEVAGRVLVGGRVIFRLQKSAAVGRGITHHSPAAMANNGRNVGTMSDYQSGQNLGVADTARARVKGGRHIRQVMSPSEQFLNGYAAGARSAGGRFTPPPAVTMMGPVEIYPRKSTDIILGGEPVPAVVSTFSPSPVNLLIETGTAPGYGAVRTAGLAPQRAVTNHPLGWPAPPY